MTDNKPYNIFYTLYFKRSSIIMYKTHVLISDISFVKTPFL